MQQRWSAYSPATGCRVRPPFRVASTARYECTRWWWNVGTSVQKNGQHFLTWENFSTTMRQKPRANTNSKIETLYTGRCSTDKSVRYICPARWSLSYIYVNVTVIGISTYTVTTCLENLEMSGILTAVREMSGILLKVREVSGKSGLKLYCWLHICVHSWFCWVCAFYFGFGSWTVAFLPPPLTITLVQAYE